MNQENEQKDELQALYLKIESLRNNGVKMKEIADWLDIAPSVLSSLYTTVLPNYIELSKTHPEEEALDSALMTVNNISKKRLLSQAREMLLRLKEMKAVPIEPPIKILQSYDSWTRYGNLRAK